MNGCEGCELETCQDCCQHQFDADEGYICLGCGLQQDIGELIDAAEYSMGDR